MERETDLPGIDNGFALMAIIEQDMHLPRLHQETIIRFPRVVTLHCREEIGIT